MAAEPGSSPREMFNQMIVAAQEDLQALKRKWWVFTALGVGMAIVGILAIGSATIATLATMFVFGWLMLIVGIFQVGGSFLVRSWGGFFLSLLTGLLYAAVGFIAINRPAESATVYTLMLAAFFLVMGLFRMIVGATTRFRHRGWMIVNGLLSLLLGILIWQQWPYSGLWVIGLFVGIELIFTGYTYMMLGLTLHGMRLGDTRATGPGVAPAP